MARRRYISTEISIDSRINKLAKTGGDFAVMLYMLMIPHADDLGILHGDTDELMGRLIPLRRDKTPDEFEQSLRDMEALGLIEWQAAAEQIVLPAEAFYRYQTYIKPENRRGATPKNAAKEKPAAENAEDKKPTPQNAAKRRESAENAASVSVSPSVTVTPSVTERASAVEKHGSIPESELPPPQDAEEWQEAGLHQTYPDADRLHEAFWSVRYPSKPFNPLHGEIAAARRSFVPMADAGMTMAQVKQATAAALRRFKDRTQVTPAAIARHWSALLEDDPPPVESSPGGGSVAPKRLTPAQQRAKDIQDRNNAELERDLAEIDRWAEQQQQQTGAPLPPALRIASGGVA